MPKRTNAFQKLVFLLERQLAGKARVTESAELLDKSNGKLREVDILIETSVGEHAVLVGIECMSQKRPSTVEWVEQMWAKHRDLPTDKLILVSASGFCKSAEKKAAALKIETYTFRQAHAADWTVIVNKLARIYFTPIEMKPVACRIVLHDNVGEFTVPLGDDVNMVIYDANGDDIGDLLAIVKQAITATDKRHVHEECSEQDKVNFGFDFDLDKPCFVRDTTGELHEVLSFHAEAEAWRTEVVPVDLTHSSFGEAQIAYGQFDSETYNGHITIMITEREGEQHKISLLLQTNDDPDGTISDGIVPKSGD